METRRKVVLYGDSLVLAGVGQSLKNCPRLQVIHLDAPPATINQELDAVSPNVVILDLGAVESVFAFALLHRRPDLLLIGLDPGGDRLLILSGEHARALSTADLVRLIESTGDPPGKELA